MTLLTGWQNFYVIVGSSAGALIGLQFVVITLIANTSVGPVQEQASAAFATPTIVHFTIVLLLAAVQTAPWGEIGPVEIFWVLLGLGGIVYEIIVVQRMRAQNRYEPVFEDWLFHALLPFAAYALIALSSFIARSNAAAALFVLAAAVLTLLFVGIHNAWDAVTYHVYSKTQKREQLEQKE